MTHCPFCEHEHGERFLCDPAKAYLDAVKASGADLTMPDVQFDRPIPALELGLGLDAATGDRMIVQVVVQASMIEVGGTWHPSLVFTGLDAQRQRLPRWLYAGSQPEVDAVAKLVRRQADAAIKATREHNRRARP